MICALTDDQQRQFRKFIAKNLQVASVSTEPFDVKAFIQSIYNTVKDASGNEELALSYVALAPKFIFQISGIDDAVNEGLSSKDVSFDSLNKLSRSFADANKGLDSIREYLGMTKNIAEEVRQLTEAVKEEQKREEKKEKPVTKQEKKVIPAADPNFTAPKSEYEFSARKPTAMADRDQEAKAWIKGQPGYNVPNPAVAFYFRVKRRLLSQLKDPSVNYDGSKIDLGEYRGKGIYLTFMSLSRLDKSMVRPFDLRLRENGKSNYDNNEPVLVLTDEYGSPLYFNEEGALDLTGKPSYYYVRDIKPEQVTDGKVSLKKEDVKHAEAMARQMNISVQKAEEQIRKQLQTIYDMREALKNNPDLIIRNNINGGSMGYPGFDWNTNTKISDINFGKFGFKPIVETMTNPSKGTIEGFTYIQTEETGPLMIELERPAVKSMEGLVDTIANLLTGELYNQYGNKIGIQERRDLIKPYFMTRGRILDMSEANEDGSYTVRLYGDAIYRSIPTKTRNSQTKTWEKIAEAPTKEQLDADRAKAKEAADKIKNYLNNLSIQNEVKNPTAAQKEKAVPGADPSVISTMTKEGIFHNTTDNTYWAVGYPKVNAANLANQDYKEVTITDKNGRLTVETTVKPYNSFIKDNFTIHYPINEEGKIVSLNAYFTFEPVTEDLEKIYKKEEPKVETKVEAPTTKDSSIASNDIKSGIDAAFDDPDLNKNLDQKNANKKATLAQIEAARKWYEAHPMRQHIPFETLFNLVNAKNPRAVANWTLHGITLYKGSDYSDLYHEAWHGFSQAFLTKEQKKALYAEVAKMSGSFDAYDGKRVRFKDATDKQIEEYLAEDFRKWMLDGGKAEIAAPVKKSIFQKILGFLKALFGDLSPSQINADAQALRTVHELYEKLRVGNLNEYSFSEDNVVFGILDKGAQAIKEDATVRSLSYEDSRFITEAMDSFMSKFVDDFSQGKRNQLLAQDPTAKVSYKWTGTLLKNPKGIKYAYEQIRKDFIDVRNGLAKAMEEATTDEKKNALQKQINRIDWAIENFGDIDNLIANRPKKGEFPKGMIGYHMLKSQVLEAETKEAFFDEDVTKEEDLFLKGREGFDRNGNEASLKDLASKEILFILRGLHKVDKNGNIVYVPGTETNVEVEGVTAKRGIPQMEDFDRIWNVLAKTLQNTTDAGVMYDKLVALGVKNPTFPIAQLLNKLGPVDTLGKDETNIWTNFWQTFNKTRVPLLQTTVEISNLDEAGGQTLPFENWTYNIRPGIAFSNAKRIAISWQQAFSADETRFIKPDRGGVNYLDLQEVIKEYPTKASIAGRELEFLNDIGFRLDKDNEDIQNALAYGEINAVAFWIVVKNLSQRRDSKGQPAVKITRIDQLKANYPSTFLRDSSGNIIYDTVRDKSGKSVKVEVEVFRLKAEGGNYNAILEAQAKYSDKMSNFMVTNAEGNTQFEHTLNSSLTIMVNSINDSEDYQSLIALPWMNHLDVKRNPFAKSSLWLNSIFDMKQFNSDGSKNENFGKRRLDKKGNKVELKLENLSGVAIKKNGEFEYDKGTASAKADVVTKLLMDFHMVLLKGAPELMRHADKGTSFSVYLSSIYSFGDKASNTYVNMLDYLRNIDNVDGSPTGYTIADEKLFNNILLPHIGAELSRIQQMRQMKKDGVENFDFKYLDRGQGFVAFSDVLTVPTKKALLKVKGDLTEYLATNTQESSALKAAMARDVHNYFTKESARVEKMFNKAKGQDGKPLISKNLINNLYGAIRNDEDLKSDFTPYKNTEAAKQALIKSFVANSFVHNLESISIIYGDLAQYNMAKEEFHKRNAGVGSTGTIYRTDRFMKEYINNVLGRGYQSKEFSGTPVKTFDGTFDTAVLKDSEVRSAYFKEYAQAMIEDEMSRQTGSESEKKAKAEKIVLGYNPDTKKVGTINDPLSNGTAFAYWDMKEGDAQGWITFDSYRIMLTLEGKWSEAQERLYQKIVNNEYVSPGDIAQFFPPQKVQYFGPLKTDGLPITAFHKFSLFPLVPSVIQDTRLKDLHAKMISQGVDYAVFQSGSKVGTITKAGKNDKFYLDDTNRVIDDQETFTKNTIFINYLKNQLEIAPVFKEKTIFSTQLRKLIEEGLVEGGVPVDFEPSIKNLNTRREEWAKLKTEEEKEAASYKYKLYKAYESNVAELTKLKKKELLEEMQWKMVDGKPVGNLDTLLEFIRKELTKQDMADHEVDFIDLGYGGKKLKHDLSMSLSAEKIEKMLNSIVTRRLIKQKVNGEALIQISGAGFENVASTGRNYANPTAEDLKKWGTNDLPFYHRKADGTTAPMKVKIALQGNFKKLLDLKDNDGFRIGSIEKLNTLLKDDTWLDKNDHRRMITMVGVRIPVQGLNSMEFMEVYEFLPEEAGNIIVPPAEIVAKAGSDFDIDKLTVMMPTYRSQKEKDGTLSVVLAKQVSQSEARDLYNKAKEYVSRKELTKGQKNQLAAVDRTLAYPEVYDDLMYSIFGFTAEELDQELVEMLVEEGKLPSFDDFYKKLNGTKAVENDLIWNIKEILELPSNFVSLVKPNGTDLVKPLADELAAKVVEYNPKKRLSGDIAKDAEELGEDPKTISGTRIFEIGYNLYKHSSNNIGKQVLGIGAVDNTFNTIFNRIGAYMNAYAEVPVKSRSKQTFSQRQTLLMPHNTYNINGEQVISLSHLDAKDGNRISDLISQLMNGWVDIAKDAWIFNLQGNKEISPALLFMIQAGVPFKTAVYLVSQPIVRDYVENQRLAKSTFGDLMGTAGDNINLFRVEARKRIFSDPKYGFNINPEKANLSKKALHDLGLIYLSNLPKEDNGQFNEDKLLKEIDAHSQALNSGNEPTYSGYQRAALMHFFEIEDMSRVIRDVKMRLNFDTSKSDSLFDAQNRSLMLASLKEESRIPSDMADKILKETVIGSFYIQPFQLEVWKDLFPLRNHKALNDFINEKLKENIQEDVNKTFGDTEKFVNEFRNQLVSFIFQNSVKSFDIDSITHYKGDEIVSAEPSSKLNEKEKVNSLTIGVFFKNGKAYYDKNTLVRHYLNDVYSKDADGYGLLGLAPVNKGVITSQEEYNHFVFEREYLRSIYPNVSSLEKNIEFNSIRNVLKSDFASLANETGEAFTARLNARAYEEFLKEKALENILNLSKLFKGDNTFADKLLMIKKNYPELGENYSLINKLVISSGKGATNIQIKDPLDDRDIIGLYYENMLSLMDPTVKKVEDAEANKMISEFFSKLPLVGFMQSGLNTRGELSLNRFLPQDSFIRIMEKPMKEYTEKLNPQLLDVYYRAFVRQNSFSNGVRNRIQNYVVPSLSLDASYKAAKTGKTYVPEVTISREIPQGIIGIDSTINDLRRDIAEREQALEEALLKQENKAINPYVFIADNLPKITPESARKETGTKVRTVKDINPSLLSNSGVSVERASEILATKLEEENMPPLSEAAIRDEIIEMLQLGKTVYKKQKGFSNEEVSRLKADISYLKEQLAEKLASSPQIEGAALLEQLLPVKPGIEISSSAKGLGAALTNPTELAKEKGNLKNSYDVYFRGKLWKDAEAAYQAHKDSATKDEGPNSTYRLMVDIIKAKLTQHPRLIEEINKQGGSAWILSSTHQPTSKNTVWETGGKNWFIKALEEAYRLAKADHPVGEPVIQAKNNTLRMNAKALTPEIAKALAEATSDRFSFVFNDSFAENRTQPQGLALDRVFKAIPVSNKVGIPSYSKYSITVQDAIKDVNGEISPDMKARIDEAIKLMKQEVEDGKTLVFSSEGYGQEWNNVYPVPMKRAIDTRAPKTFLYLSEQLYRNFGYINPGYELKPSGKAVIQETQEITDEMVRDFMLNCYR